MLFDRFIVVELSYMILIVIPSIQMSSVDTMTQLLNIVKLSTLNEDVDKIVDLLGQLKANCSKVEMEYKKLFFGLDKIVHIIDNGSGYKCEDGVLYDKLCLKYYDQPVSFSEAQQTCLGIGGTLFRPNFRNPDVIQEIKALFPDLVLHQAMIDVSLECTLYGSFYQYSNGLIIPDKYLTDYEDCVPVNPPMRTQPTGQVGCEQLDSYAINFDSTSPEFLFKCFTKSKTQLPFICQCDAVYEFPDNDINLLPSEIELELINLHNLHRNLKEQIDKVEKQLQEASINFKARKDPDHLRE